MMEGDSGPWKALLSPSDDVLLLGAFGGVIRDRAAADARFDQTAEAYRAGRGYYETLAAWISADLACIVLLEHHEARLAGDEPVTYTYRVTHLLRREGDAWKVVLRHADPLVAFRGPVSVLPINGGLYPSPRIRITGEVTPHRVTPITPQVFPGHASVDAICREPGGWVREANRSVGASPDHRRPRDNPR